MKQLTKITFEEGVEEISSGSMVDSCSALTTIVLPSTLKYISGNATFSDAAALTDINLPEGVTFSNSNGVSHFSGCTSLESIELPASMSVIPSNMFKGCTALTTVTAKGTISKIENNAFENCKNLVTIPDLSNVTSIEDYAFRYCEKLTEVDLSSVTELGMYAFGNCTSLSGVLDLSNLVSIGTRAFSSCGIEGVIFGESLESIGKNAFYNSSLSGKVEIPDSVTSIGSAAFSGTNVTEFYIGSGVKELPLNALASVALEKVTVNNSKDGIVGIDDALPFNFKAEDVVYLHVSIDDDVGDTISTGGPSLQEAVNAGGEVKIEKHVKLSAPVTVPAGVNVTITADENWQIIGTSGRSIENLFIVQSGASVEFTGNVILSGRYNTGSIIDNAGTISDGYISNNTGCRGTGVLLYGYDDVRTSFTMTGGYIQNNTGESTYDSNDVVNASGAVYVVNNAEFNMSGGTISGNTGYSGGGVTVVDGKVQNGSGSWADTEFNMTAGAISGNRATARAAYTLTPTASRSPAALSPAIRPGTTAAASTARAISTTTARCTSISPS